MNADDIREIIKLSHPNLSKLLSKVEPIEPLKPRPISVLDAISRIVIGQMLSRKAAQVIINNTIALSTKKKLSSVAHLSQRDLRLCGVSQRKAKTIHLFADCYRKNKSEIEKWRKLSPDLLYERVNSHWGLSNWSASMLGIFYFGIEDIFPYEDGSIKRAIKMLESSNTPIYPHLVSPFRSYLALYLWKFLDNQILVIE